MSNWPHSRVGIDYHVNLPLFSVAQRLLWNSSVPFGYLVTLTEEELNQMYADILSGKISTDDFDMSQFITSEDCSHVWKEYVGFTERYEYCIHCDVKKDTLD